VTACQGANGGHVGYAYRAGWGWTVLHCGLHAHGVSVLLAILEERDGEGLGC